MTPLGWKLTKFQNSVLHQHPLDTSIEPINHYPLGSEVILTVRFPAFAPGHKRHIGSSSEPSPVGTVMSFCTVVDEDRNLVIKCMPEFLTGDNEIILFLRVV